ncbi:MAG: ribonuclease HII [Bacteroidales bacterium]|nr:ribonuclease HII [Bacteroidales bacterium]
MSRQIHLLPKYSANLVEAGCDEAGRGPLAGPVFAAAVILPDGFSHPLLNDSKKMNANDREKLRAIIEREAVAWAVVSVSAEEIDRINILNASITGMQRAVTELGVKPDFVLVDGNRFKPFGGFSYKTVVHGDAIYADIAAASVLAKTHRDEYMKKLALEYPEYGWERNMGYPTAGHIEAIRKYGYTPHHRKSFHPKELEPVLF